MRKRGSEVETEVSLNLYIQLSGVIYLPIWDAMQKMLTQQMMAAFEKQAWKLLEDKKKEVSVEKTTVEEIHNPGVKED